MFLQQNCIENKGKKEKRKIINNPKYLNFLIVKQNKHEFDVKKMLVMKTNLYNFWIK